MSWYIQFLLRHREEIRESAYKEPSVNYVITHEDGNDDYGYTTPNHESDEFNDLLLIEKTIVELYKDGIITKDDIRLVELVGTGTYFPDVAKEMGKGIHSDTIADRFMNICTLTGYKLNNIFSDEEVCKTLKEKHNLTDEQVGKLRKYMKSKLKNKLVKKKYDL